MHRLGDELQQPVAATHQSDKSLHRFASATEFLSPQQVAQILSDLIFFHMLLRQNSVAKTKIFSKILQYTRSDFSLRRVAAAVTWSCNLSPSVHRPLDMRTCRQFRQRLFFQAAILLERVPSQSKRHKSFNRPLSFIFIITIITITIIIIIVTPQNVILTQNVIRIAAKWNTNAKCNNIDAKCNKIFNAECNNLSTQIVITFLTHNVITQNVIISE